MKILIINNETIDIEKLRELFKDNETDICNIGEYFDENRYDLYVLSGGSHHSIFFEPSPYQKEIDFIKNTDKKVIGICLGCQIIAQAYGSTIDTLPERVIGIIDIQYKNTIYQVFEAHRYAIKTLGTELYGLVRSKYGYEIIKHKTKAIRGFQFHPEKHMGSDIGRSMIQEIMNDDG